MNLAGSLLRDSIGLKVEAPRRDKQNKYSALGLGAN